MSDCLFCKIVAGEIPSTKVYEDDAVYAFRDINPMAPVHVLIVPKQHLASADEVCAEINRYITEKEIPRGITYNSYVKNIGDYTFLYVELT